MSNKNLPGDGNMTEDVLRDAGKSEHEVESTGKIDRADEAVDAMYGERQRTANSPVHKAVWQAVDLSTFGSEEAPKDALVDETVEACLKVVRDHRTAGTLYDEHGKIRNEVLADLGKAGYWGMRIDPKFGGKGSSDRAFMRMITRMATLEATIAGLASIHGCIGAVDPVKTFGNEQQQNYFLPKLASGETLSAFALTEPGAGSDMTALKTTAVLDGDHYVVNGEKLFISNAIPGRTVGLVVMINGKPSVLITELPKEENENFHINKYPIYALTRTYNNGLIFKNFRVPKENLLEAPAGNGLIIAYHGLNYGRVALCANASGVMRVMLRSITPKSWAAYRKTYGEAIETRELVKRRVARLAALIVGADALVAWCSSLLDAGYRGELECIIAKIFGSEAQKEAAIELLMKTHGGRSFLKGHLLGDNIHDFLAPCIYEGEGEMLGMAFFKSLAKDHGMQFMLPLGNAMKAIVKEKKVLKGLGGLAYNGSRYALWYTPRKLCSVLSKFARFAATPVTAPLSWLGRKVGLVSTGVDARLHSHVKFAERMASETALELTDAMRKHQLKLADRQCRIALLSQRVQDTMIMVITATYALQNGNAATKAAADVLCQDLHRKLTGAQPSDAYFKACSKLAEMVANGEFEQINDVPSTAILQQYGQQK